MSDPFLATVMPVAFQFAPQDWQTCQGQNLPVNQYSALYSLLGVTFGGSASKNFNLPDLQGRTIVGQGYPEPQWEPDPVPFRHQRRRRQRDAEHRQRAAGTARPSAERRVGHGHGDHSYPNLGFPA